MTFKQMTFYWPTWRGTETPGQWPCVGTTLDADSLAPGKPSDDGSAGQHRDCSLMRDPEPEPPS